MLSLSLFPHFVFVFFYIDNSAGAGRVIMEMHHCYFGHGVLSSSSSASSLPTHVHRIFDAGAASSSPFACSSGNFVTSINNTQNGHKGISSNQGDSSVVGSPARRSEVSPIQNHVSTHTLYHLINFISLLNTNNNNNRGQKEKHTLFFSVTAIPLCRAINFLFQLFHYLCVSRFGVSFCALC